MLKAENIFKSFVDRSNRKTFELLHDVSLELKSGEAVALMGGSGSGKSTTSADTALSQSISPAVP